jgi:Tfp pilus assembly protein PilF
MDESDIESQLQQRIKEQAAQIAVALGYLHAGKPELANEVLEAALPELEKK